MIEREIQIYLNKPHPSQQKVIDEAKRFNVLCCGRRWGKSALAVNLLSECALEAYPASYFAPTYKLLEVTFKEILTALNPIIDKKHDNQFIQLINGGVIDFWSLDNSQAGRSRKYKRVIIDEGAYVKNLWEAWTEAIRPALSDLKGDAWFLSTPKGKNDFYKLFSRGIRSEENWMSWQMSTYTNPFIDAEEIDDARSDLPQLAFEQEYLAEFSENIANPFGHAYIQQCTFPISKEPAVCYGIDLAKSFDWTVITGLDKNGSVCHFERFQDDWKNVIQKILNLPNVPMAIDSTGVGDPIAEQIQQSRTNVEAFRFTQQSKQQLMEGLALAIQKRNITFPEGEIKNELESFEYQYTRTGTKYSAPSGMHDDCVMSLALAVRMHTNSNASGNYNLMWV